ncbi:MAG: thermonuclease family protein [Lachnospiraceae bacterium]|nr:thermonuclease family protein [Lachnospiraceae bacterium]
MKKWIRLTAYLFLLASILSVLVSCNQKKTDPAPSGDTNVTTEAPDKTTEARQETTGAPSDDTTAPVDPSQKIDYAGQLKLNLDSETKKYEVTVRQYVDGDTTHFDVPEDISESGVLKARYLGVNTPESTGTIEKWGKQASNFTKEKLSSATSIYVESDDGNWNFDNTSSHRCLCWVWYKPQGASDYRNLNVELLQEGYAIANNSAGNRYGETCMAAISQAKELGLHVYSDEKDPLFYEGAVQEVTLKALRTTPDTFLGINVSFEATIVREYSNTLYVEEYDEEDGIYYGMNVYYGFSADPDCLAFMKIGNRVRFVGSMQYYEAGGTWQISGIQYKPRKPEESCGLVEEGEKPDYVVTDPSLFTRGKKAVIVTKLFDGEAMEVEEEFSYAELVLSTGIEFRDLHVESVYTTTNDSSSSKGAMTLTCKAPDGAFIDVRTVVLHDENGELITASAYQGKTIDVQGVVDYYSGTYQIKVFAPEDITVH